MKAISKKLYGFLLLAALSLMLAIPAKAEVATFYVTYAENLNLRHLSGGNFYFISLYPQIGKGEITSVTSSNEDALSVGNMSKSNTFYLMTTAKKGKYKVSIEAKKPNGKKVRYTCNITVKDYKTPVKYIKVGSKKAKLQSKKKSHWTKTFPNYVYDSKGKGIAAKKLKIKAKAGWKLEGAFTTDMTGNMTKIKKVNLKKKIKGRVKKRKFFHASFLLWGKHGHFI